MKIPKDPLLFFEELADVYDRWYDENPLVYESELAALRAALPKGQGIEIGVGSGRFAATLGIATGIDPSPKMVEMAKKRGINAVLGYGEHLPFKEGEFDFALLVGVLCFVKEPFLVVQEAARVVKNGGLVIMGEVPSDSKWGRIYKGATERNPFLEVMTLHSPETVIQWMERAGLRLKQTLQTLYQGPFEFLAAEIPRPGHDQGSFVVYVGEAGGRK
ncbi:MAG: methyltransferase domain-containing protein [Armatimonadetes bacterium]|nr:methyltransferase domain-containing protein [Armatimonadota bacterium]